MNKATHAPRFFLLMLACFLLAQTGDVRAQEQGDAVVLSWNDLGMHCMNKDFDQLAILPPYNNLWAQVILLGDSQTLPQIITDGVTLEYSIPGNTYSAGKTNFWDYVYDLFGMALPPDIGLTGLGLTGEFTAFGDHFTAEGIPITPFTDAEPTVEDPYQQALVILRNLAGTELFRSEPVIPVSTEINCVSSGCHSSVNSILYSHENEGGYNPADQPILCAWCHGSPPLTGLDPGPAGYFSMRMHGQHTFIDETIPGIAGCEKCHPGPQTECLRGTMATDYGMICQDCHGNMDNIKQSIDDGRIPWVEEPACRNCHTAQYGEPVGVLYRNATGHGGVYCAGCHNSPHAIWPSREARDNANAIALQGHAGILSDCTVCHGSTPQGPGPHGYMPTDVVEAEIGQGATPLAIHPNPLPRGSQASIRAASARSAQGKLLVFDAQGRTVRLLHARADGPAHVRATWDGTLKDGRRAPSGVYFLRWQDATSKSAGKLVLLD